MPAKISIFSVFVVSLCFLVFVGVCDGYVVGVDYGTKWMKVAVLKSGTINVVLNEQTKRKSPSVVAFYHGDERLIGADALSLATKVPHKVYQDMKVLLGARYSNQTADHFLEAHLPYTFIPHPSRGTVLVKHSDDTTFSPEELVAMQLSYARHLAELDVGGPVRECVITVPPFFSFHQRRALENAASLAGMKVLSLLSDGAAVSLSYGMYRRFEKPEYHIFFDLGAETLKVCLTEFSGSETKKKSHGPAPPGQLKILATAWDEKIGGARFTEVIARLLAEKFVAKHGGSIEDLMSNRRAVAKMMVAAEKAKIVLSANTDTRVYLEGLHDDKDLVCPITRDEFYRASSHLLSKILVPARTVLHEAKVDMDKVDSIVLFGGATRIPKVQDLLKEWFDRIELAHKLNTDEAAVMGATFYAGELSILHRVRDFKVKDSVPRTVTASLSDGKSTKLYPKNDGYPSTKVLTFSNEQGIGLDLLYDEDSYGIPSIRIGHVDVHGKDIERAIAEKEFNGTISKPKLSFSFRLGMNLLPDLEKVDVVIDEEYEVTIKKLVEKKKEEKKKEEKGDKKEEEEESEEEEEPEYTYHTVNKTRTHKLPLGLKLDIRGLPAISESETEESLRKLKILNDAAKQRQENAEAKNTLESYLYGMRDKLYDENVEEVSTEEQRKKVLDACSETSEWLYGEGEDLVASEYRKELEKLKALGGDEMLERALELEKRPISVKNAFELINATRSMMGIWETDEYSGVTDNEIGLLLALCENKEKWLIEQTEKQSTWPKHLKPVFISKDVETEMMDIKREFERLLKKPRRTPTPTPTPIPTEVPSPSPTTSIEDIVVEGPATTPEAVQKPVDQGYSTEED